MSDATEIKRGKQKVTRASLDEKMADIKARKDELVRREQEAVGHAAERAGVLELGLTEAELVEQFEQLVARFRAAPDTAASGAGPTIPERPHAAKKGAGKAASAEIEDAIG
jgi:hypothetical protein